MQDIETIKTDIRDIYNRLNDNTAKSNEVLTELKVQLARLAEAMNNLRLPDRPCEQFKSLQKEFDCHISQQQQNTNIWKSAIIRTMISYACAAATIVVSVYYATKV